MDIRNTGHTNSQKFNFHGNGAVKDTRTLGNTEAQQFLYSLVNSIMILLKIKFHSLEYLEEILADG
jgi:hypothetical protein